MYEVGARTYISSKGSASQKGNGQELLKVLSRSGVCDILLALEEKPCRFSQLMFKCRLNPGVLSRHLTALQNLEIVAKPSEEYHLTSKGKKIIEVIKEILKETN